MPFRGDNKSTGGEFSAEAILRRQKAQDAIKLRIAGHSLDEIREQLDYKTRRDVLNAIIKEIKASGREPAEQAREIELQRLDHMLERLQPGIDKGDVRAVSLGIAISDRRANLMGLDKPPEGRNDTRTIQISITRSDLPKHEPPKMLEGQFREIEAPDEESPDTDQ
jgi:DNA-binding transcriptional MerR regulator